MDKKRRQRHEHRMWRTTEKLSKSVLLWKKIRRGSSRVLQGGAIFRKDIVVSPTSVYFTPSDINMGMSTLRRLGQGMFLKLPTHKRLASIPNCL
jgi:hypothetical protein